MFFKYFIMAVLTLKLYLYKYYDYITTKWYINKTIYRLVLKYILTFFNCQIFILPKLKIAYIQLLKMKGVAASLIVFIYIIYINIYKDHPLNNKQSIFLKHR